MLVLTLTKASFLEDADCARAIGTGKVIHQAFANGLNPRLTHTDVELPIVRPVDLTGTQLPPPTWLRLRGRLDGGRVAGLNHHVLVIGTRLEVERHLIQRWAP